MTPIRRTDNNHAEIRGGLRKAGYWCWDTHELGKGFPDLIALNKAGEFVLLEVKTKSGKLTDDELAFFVTLIEKYHSRRLFVVYNLDDALEALNV